MPIVVNTNTASINAQRYLTMNNTQLSKSMEKLASGFRINRAGDDAAGLFVSENLRSQIRGSQKALDNTQDGINVLNIVDGAYQVVEDSLQRIRELVVQAGNETYSQAQRTAINLEIDQLRADIDRVAATTQFNGTVLTTGLAALNLQVGANGTTNDALDIGTALGNLSGTATTANGGLNMVTAAVVNISSNATARAFLTGVDAALTTLNTRRATLGAMVNRLEGVAKSLMNAVENNSAAESRIRNVDVAAESANMTRYNILQQSSAAILSQANQTPALALQLLQG